MSFISSIGSAIPRYPVYQRQIIHYFKQMMDLSDYDARKMGVMLRMSGINQRYSVLEDFSEKPEATCFYQKEELPSTEKRMLAYAEYAPQLALEAVRDCINNYNSQAILPLLTSEITDLVVVSCTGMFSPGIEHTLISELGLRPDINKTLIQFMGCCAAFNGLKTADALCTSKKGKVLVVCVELSTLHLQIENNEDNVRANILFGDGASCALIENDCTNVRQAFEIQLTKSCYFPQNKSDMAWQITDKGFKMRLSEYIPDLIEGNIKTLFKSFFDNLDENDMADYELAVHPGGIKVLQAVETALSMPSSKNKYAYEVLSECGNMSSATILFVLKKMLYTEEIRDKKIITCAFGPGLTMEGALLQKVLNSTTYAESSEYERVAVLK